jgi:hypothetical protein
MKVELDENGMLFVTPETPTEAFALQHWWSCFSPALSPEAGPVSVGIGVKQLVKDQP